MNLILWRHAAATEIEADDPITDHERPLTRRGQRQAALIAAWLHARLPAEFQVVASPARRTRETAHALVEAYRMEESIAPGATAQGLLAAAGWPAERGTVVVVGHQPTLGRAASLLLTGREENWAIRKGAVWWFSDRDREEGPAIVLRAVMQPDLA